ncbi:MAG: hypothetical protein JOZ19_15915 [Rubrobacter sp.]|nr:hypothetical protein [Rubrobacter sp.]
MTQRPPQERRPPQEHGGLQEEGQGALAEGAGAAEQEEDIELVMAIVGILVLGSIVLGLLHVL